MYPRSADGSLQCQSSAEIKKAFLQKCPGLKGLTEEYFRVHPDQPDPLQVKALVKCWMGGPDPLDYISMYSHKGIPNLGVLPHWHYVTYGLSDLYGDGRIFPPHVFGEKSGFGFELTFRLLKDPNDSYPPTWPANLLQNLARYVYASAHTVGIGDHIAWYQALNIDDQNGENNRLNHIITIRDPEFQTLNTPLGSVEFVQIVPVTSEELLAVQRWNVSSFAEIMARIPECGGEYLVADINRTMSAFDISPEVTMHFNEGVERDGSDLNGASARACAFCDDAWKYYDETNLHFLKDEYQSQLLKLKEHLNLRPVLNDPGPHGACGIDKIKLKEDLDSQVRHFNKYREPKSGCAESSSSSSNYSDDDGPGPSIPYDENTDVMLSGELYDRLNCGPTGSQCNFNPGIRNYSTNCSAMSVSRSDSHMGIQIHYFDNIHVTLDVEAGFLMATALKGRLKHGRCFTYTGLTCQITLAPPTIQGLFVNPTKRYGVQLGGPKPWVQILVDGELLDSMIRDFDDYLNQSNAAYPKTLLWPENFLAVTIVL